MELFGWVISCGLFFEIALVFYGDTVTHITSPDSENTQQLHLDSNNFVNLTIGHELIVLIHHSNRFLFP